MVGQVVEGDVEVEDGIIRIEDNYPSKGSGERGAFFRDSEGNLLSIGEAIYLSRSGTEPRFLVIDLLL